LFGSLKTKLHTPIFKNIEFQLWKRECFEKASKESVKVVNNEEVKKTYPSSLYKKNFSDTKASALLIKEVRSYLSLNSINYPHVSSKKATPLGSRSQLNHFSDYMRFHNGNNNIEGCPQYGAVGYPMEYSKGFVPVYVPIIMHPSTFQMPIRTEDTYTGRIKFFDYTQNYGFFTLDCDGSDLFVHYEDFLKAGICKEQIQVSKAIDTRFSFQRVAYYGKYNLSSKAANIKAITESY